MKVAHAPAELEQRPRAVALGVFDGVHLGHRAVLQAALDAQGTTTVVTFDPHPRTVLGRPVALLATLERRLELLDDAGIEETLVVQFTSELAACEAETFAREYLLDLGAEVVVAGAGFKFGRGRAGGLDTLRALGIDARAVPLVAGISSTRVRKLIEAGDVRAAAALLGRAVEVEGTVVSGDRRGTTLGFPTANLEPHPHLLIPPYGIYAGEADGARAAVSIGVNPHYGGSERRIEAFLLDYHGDLYGQRLVVELWERLREERAFASEAELVEQIDRDVEWTRAAVRPGPR